MSPKTKRGPSELGRALLHKRTERGQRIEDAAYVTGLSYSMLTKLEAGHLQSIRAAPLLSALAKYLGVTLTDAMEMGKSK